MPPKRKASDLDHSDSEEEATLGSLRQVLPIANLPNNFSGEPIDGLQYLFTVRRHARTLPRFTRVANPYEVNEEPVEPQESTSGMSIPHPALPSEEWREAFLKRFRNFRKNSAQPTIHVHVPASASPQKAMPDKKYRDYWWAFIEGRPQSEWDPPKKQNRQNRGRNDRYNRGLRAYPEGEADTELSYDHPEESRAYECPQEALHADDARDTSMPKASGSLPTPSGTPAPHELGTSEAFVDVVTLAGPSRREPTPSLMQHIDHRFALHLLMYFTHWINVHLERQRPLSHFTHTHARWMFVLLSRVEDYVSADETSLLRNLARACIWLIKENLQQRKVAGPDASPEATTTVDATMDERSCWLIITAIVGIWGQRDLWMDAEEMLAKLEA